MQRETGFHVIEMIVMLAIMISLAGIVAPVVGDEMQESRNERAQATVNSIVHALNRYFEDTNVPPSGRNGGLDYHYLASGGKNPIGNPFSSGPKASLDDFFFRNTTGTSLWSGSYLSHLDSDPWGNQYLVNVHGYFVSNERIWVISAGPDGRLETRAHDVTPRGDDIGVKIY